jgi:hypothetical protein
MPSNYYEKLTILIIKGFLLCLKNNYFLNYHQFHEIMLELFIKKFLDPF